MLKGFYFLLIWPYFEAFSGLFEDFGKWLDNRMQRWRTEGFTLVEMSMVLVVIGLLVGGVLVGVDLVKAAETRATISQIEKFNQAANAFKLKYNFLPGDIPDPYASQFGFQARGTNPGEGDGNGVIEGACGYPNYGNGFNQGCGEIPVFWEDLSEAGFLDATIYGHDTKGANYPWTSGNILINNITLKTTPAIKDWLPSAKIGNGNYIYIWSLNGNNYFAVSAVYDIGYTIESNTALTVAQAYNIDKKIDDGLPQSGNVTAQYLNFTLVQYNIMWAGGSAIGAAPGASAPSSTTACYDNGSGTGTMQYSMEVSNGSNPNCALSFKMQGAAR